MPSANTQVGRLRAGVASSRRSCADRRRPGLDEGREPAAAIVRTTATTTTSQRRGAAADGRRRPRRQRPRRTRPSPTRTPTSSSSTASPAPTRTTTTARTSCSRATRAARTRAGYITRINLDADAAHRVTLLATKDDRRQPIADIDGSTWDPWAQRLLFTTENAERADLRGHARTTRRRSTTSPARSAAAATRASRTTRTATSGSSRTSAATNEGRGTTGEDPEQLRLPLRAGHARRPRATASSRCCRCCNALGQPDHRGDPDARSTRPTSRAAHLRHDVRHEVGHDPRHRRRRHRAVQREPAAQGRRTRRRSSGRRTAQFRPGSNFSEFFFDETGDTNATSPENATAGGWGSRVQADPDATRRRRPGQLTMFYKGDQAHAGFDNVAFLSRNQITFVEDAGDTLHGQRNALDSGFVFDVTDATTRRRRTSRSAGSPRAATRRRRSTPRTAASARTTATTRSPASTSPTATRAPDGILGAKVPEACPAASGAGSTPSSTATTRPTRSYARSNTVQERGPAGRGPATWLSVRRGLFLVLAGRVARSASGGAAKQPVVRFAFAGDIAMVAGPGDSYFKSVRLDLTGDVVWGNLEGTLTNRGSSKCGSPELVVLRVPGAALVRAASPRRRVHRDEPREQPRDGLRAGRPAGHRRRRARYAGSSRGAAGRDRLHQGARHAHRRARLRAVSLGVEPDEHPSGARAREEGGRVGRPRRRDDARRRRGRRPPARRPRHGVLPRREPRQLRSRSRTRWCARARISSSAAARTFCAGWSGTAAG